MKTTRIPFDASSVITIDLPVPKKKLVSLVQMANGFVTGFVRIRPSKETTDEELAEARTLLEQAKAKFTFLPRPRAEHVPAGAKETKVARMNAREAVGVLVGAVKEQQEQVRSFCEEVMGGVGL